jgi:hypothetical protein
MFGPTAADSAILKGVATSKIARFDTALRLVAFALLGASAAQRQAVMAAPFLILFLWYVARFAQGSSINAGRSRAAAAYAALVAASYVDSEHPRPGLNRRRT